MAYFDESRFGIRWTTVLVFLGGVWLGYNLGDDSAIVSRTIVQSLGKTDGVICWAGVRFLTDPDADTVVGMKRRDFLQRAGLAAGAVAVNGLNLGVLATSADAQVAGLALEESFQVGDVVTFAGRFAMNPLTRKATDHLQQFVVTAVHADTITLHPTPKPALPRKQRPNALGARRTR